MRKRLMVTSGNGERCTRCGRVIANGEMGIRESGPTRWAHETACEPQTAPAREFATERQVQFATDLMLSAWTPAVLGGRRYSRAELSGMSRNEISGIIDALVAERELQNGY